MTEGIADEYQTVFSYCFGNKETINIEGRVIEVRNESIPKPSDNWLVNSYRKLRQLINDEKKYTSVILTINNHAFGTKTGEEGFFNLSLPKPADLQPGFHTTYSNIGKGQTNQCQLLIVSPENTIGIISDFDDTVIITDVLDKQQAISNTMILNYKQREVVPGMASWYREILSANSKPKFAALFFVTGSPKQLQKGINQFLDYHQFPTRTIFTKKLNGKNSDPLLNQFKYKMQKIETILAMYPTMNFVLIGDDGERDPEVYHAIYERMPLRVIDTWIRPVDPSTERKRYPEQKLLNDRLK